MSSISTFSLIAQDTKRSCMIKQSNLHHTYYLHDNKGNSWCEPAYTGNGIFGGKNFFTLCAEMNMDIVNSFYVHNSTNTLYKKLNLTHEQLESIGMEIYLNYTHDSDKNVKYPNITETDDWYLNYDENARPAQCPYGGYSDVYYENIQKYNNQIPPNFTTCIKYLQRHFIDEEIKSNVINILEELINEDVHISQPYTHFDNSIDFEFLHKTIDTTESLNLTQFNCILKEILYTTNIQITSVYIHPNVIDFCCGILNILEPNAYESYDDDDNKKLTRNVLKLCNQHNCIVQSMDDMNTIEPNLEFLSYFYDHEHDYNDFIHSYKIMKNKYNIHIVSSEKNEFIDVEQLQFAMEV